MFKIAALALLCFSATASAFTAPASLPLRSSVRANAATPVKMQQQVDLLERVETLKVLTAVSKAGLLSKAEKAGLLSTLEKQGALSQVEKLLPLADDFRVISLTKTIVNTAPSTFYFGAFAVALAEAGLIAAVPDDSGAAVAAQVVTGLLAATAVVPLVATGALSGYIQQANTPIEL
eukprot:CAMPEP_0196736096 /NCGR_PEP_ID=MMETSP1091-20130531/14271_1 /TAXON_ID=302021 /ORGANISM="Rhodomonas sp., Strain CCMP768" /LENGTH=176 /DNA_ID=CAMNT_0042079793 /DNA_START=46 /DNA_END=576 /DNA_ORIENTATION=-